MIAYPVILVETSIPSITLIITPYFKKLNIKTCFYRNFSFFGFPNWLFHINKTKQSFLIIIDRNFTNVRISLKTSSWIFVLTWGHIFHGEFRLSKGLRACIRSFILTFFNKSRIVGMINLPFWSLSKHFNILCICFTSKINTK